MIQYTALLWDVGYSSLLQCFGPYKYEADAEAAVERLKAWPAFTEGIWEVVKLYGDPEVSAPAPAPFIPYTPQRWIPLDTTVTWLGSPGAASGGTYQITV